MDLRCQRAGSMIAASLSTAPLGFRSSSLGLGEGYTLTKEHMKPLEAPQLDADGKLTFRAGAKALPDPRLAAQLGPWRQLGTQPFLGRSWCSRRRCKRRLRVVREADQHNAHYGQGPRQTHSPQRTHHTYTRMCMYLCMLTEQSRTHHNTT